MSSPCLAFKLKLPAAKKAWKSLTSKLKIIRFIHHKPKSRNKLPHQHHHHHQIIQTRRRNKKSIKGRIPLRVGLFKKKSAAPAPVYIDKLFIEQATAEKTLDQFRVPSFKRARVVDDNEEAAGPGTSRGGEGEINNKTSEAAANSVVDDMWESLGFASPLLRGIDERAEEFIARFRAEMELQEIMARNL